MNISWTNSFAAHFAEPAGAFYSQPGTAAWLQALQRMALPDQLGFGPQHKASWIAKNSKLADELGVSAWLDDAHLPNVSGDAAFAGSQPCATAYSGHQFGQWAGQLGDGRALLLGEITTPRGAFEIQLKGAGATPYSRRADGRAVLRSSIREYMCSEAMHALGIPTTRALCLVGSALPVQREAQETAAVLTRVAPSFIRFGHFEHHANQTSPEHLQRLADFCIAQYYPECSGQANPFAALLAAVAQRTAQTVALWQSVGFCHGVMNTDNMSILGLTLDYGPFDFLDRYEPGYICNHSDHLGRYAFDLQPKVAYWNLFCLAQSLMPLIGQQDAALAALEPYKTEYAEALQQAYAAKLGLDLEAVGYEAVAKASAAFLSLLEHSHSDYTLGWRALTEAVGGLHDLTEKSAQGFAEGLSHGLQAASAAPPATSIPPAPTTPSTPAATVDTDKLAQFTALYLPLISTTANDPQLNREKAQQLQQGGLGQALVAPMQRANPTVVLRKHLAQGAIVAAERGDFAETERLLESLQAPYQGLGALQSRGCAHHAQAPDPAAAPVTLSCSS